MKMTSLSEKQELVYLTLFEPGEFLVWYVDEYGFVHVELIQ